MYLAVSLFLKKKKKEKGLGESKLIDAQSRVWNLKEVREACRERERRPEREDFCA